MQLVFLPGLDGTGDLFKPILKKIPKDIRTLVIAYPKDKLLSYKELINYVNTRLPKNEKFIIVAESFSGYIAYKLVEKNHKNLVSIIFVASFLENPRPAILNFLIKVPFQYMLKIPIPLFVLKSIFFTNDTDKSILLNFQQILKSISIKTIAYRIKQIALLNKPLSKINMDVYYILAKNDKLVPYKVLKLFQKLFNNVQIYSINSGHLVLQSLPLECTDIIIKIFNDRKIEIPSDNSYSKN